MRAVKAAKVPRSVKVLQSFMGLVTFYGNFLKDLATIANPLYRLTTKYVDWDWTEDCQNSFDRIKKEITLSSFLITTITLLQLVCDASQVGLGAVLAHVMEDGTEKPTAYASKCE